MSTPPEEPQHDRPEAPVETPVAVPVVLVEDDPTQRKLYEQILTHAGYQVSTYESAARS